MIHEIVCYWCHHPLPPLPAGASYVDEINHYMHQQCLNERDETNRRREMLLEGIVDGRIDSIPAVVRRAVLERIRRGGFSRRCPCLYDTAYGFQGYESHSFEEEDYDAHNSVDGCELCGGSGNYDPLPQLLALHDDAAAAAWVARELPKSAGPCDRWSDFSEVGWQYDGLSNQRREKSLAGGVTLYNVDQMCGGVITWPEIADLFRPRRQSSLF